MSDFSMVPGFEDVWRPPVRPRRGAPQSILATKAGGADPRARLTRIANRAPEVMVKVTGRTRDPGHLRAHLDYISRNGQIEIEDPDGWRLDGRAAVREVADDWSAMALADPRRRDGAPLSHALVLSMPEGTDPLIVRDAARAFAAEVFAGRFDYGLALHTDTPRPHVHIAVRSRGVNGERLNPKKADLAMWREVFAEALRERGVEAEATPRRTRGVTRKAERTPLRKMRERHKKGGEGMSRVLQDAYREAAGAAFRDDRALRVWEQMSARRQAAVRALYLAQAKRLEGSGDVPDRVLAAGLIRFVGAMPPPLSQRLALASELRRLAQLSRDDGKPAPDKPASGKDRQR